MLTGLAHFLAPLNVALFERLDLAVRVTDSILEQQARFGPAITDSVPASPGVTP